MNKKMSPEDLKKWNVFEKRFMTAFWLIMLTLIFLAFWHGISFASKPPKQALPYKEELIRSARYEWGLNAPVAVFAAQIHTESLWNKEAVSPAGAEGLTQFMPATAKWLPEVMPGTGKPAPFNPSWAIRAMCAYNYWHWNKISAINDYEKMAFTLSAYNGGLGWVYRDRKLAEDKGLDPKKYFDSVETVNAGRNKYAFKENRSYPAVILKRRQFIYAAWGKTLTP